MATVRTPTSDKTLADLTKVITSGKPFTRSELANRFNVRPDKVSDVVARLKREGWQVDRKRTTFQGPVNVVVTPRAMTTSPGGTPSEATETQPVTTAGAATRPKPRRRARAATTSRPTAPTGIPVLGEMFEVVLLARNTDGSTSIGLRSPTSGEVQMTWPS